MSIPNSYQNGVEDTRTNLLPKRCRLGNMKASDFEHEGQGGLQKVVGHEIVRSIRMPKDVWDALDQDAERCRRSSVKQLEAVLTVYYGLADIELNTVRMNAMRGGEALGSGEATGTKGGVKKGKKE